jgi:hypothetical protein
LHTFVHHPQTLSCHTPITKLDSITLHAHLFILRFRLYFAALSSFTTTTPTMSAPGPSSGPAATAGMSAADIQALITAGVAAAVAAAPPAATAPTASRFKVPDLTTSDSTKYSGPATDAVQQTNLAAIRANIRIQAEVGLFFNSSTIDGTDVDPDAKIRDLTLFSALFNSLSGAARSTVVTLQKRDSFLSTKPGFTIYKLLFIDTTTGEDGTAKRYNTLNRFMMLPPRSDGVSYDTMATDITDASASAGAAASIIFGKPPVSTTPAETALLAKFQAQVQDELIAAKIHCSVNNSHVLRALKADGSIPAGYTSVHEGFIATLKKETNIGSDVSADLSSTDAVAMFSPPHIAKRARGDGKGKLQPKALGDTKKYCFAFEHPDQRCTTDNCPSIHAHDRRRIALAKYNKAQGSAHVALPVDNDVNAAVDANAALLAAASLRNETAQHHQAWAAAEADAAQWRAHIANQAPPASAMGMTAHAHLPPPGGPFPAHPGFMPGLLPQLPPLLPPPPAPTAPRPPPKTPPGAPKARLSCIFFSLMSNLMGSCLTFMSNLMGSRLTFMSNLMGSCLTFFFSLFLSLVLNSCLPFIFSVIIIHLSTPLHPFSHAPFPTTAFSYYAKQNFLNPSLSKCWILDSGCTQHMTPFESDFLTKRPTSVQVNGINPDHPTTATHIGTAVFTPHAYSRRLPALAAQDTLFVPTMTARLLSATRLMAQNFVITLHIPNSHGECGFITSSAGIIYPLFYYNKLVILHASFDPTVSPSPATAIGQPPPTPTPDFAPGTPAPAAPRRPAARTPSTPATTPPSSPAATTPPSPPPLSASTPTPTTPTPTAVLNGPTPFLSLPHSRQLWHLRSCHRGADIEHNTAHVVTGAPSFSRNEKLDLCTTCTNSKSHHKPVPHKRTRKRKRHPARRLVYTDWWGPYSTPGIGGEKYIQGFIDEDSGFVGTFASASKDCGAANLRAFRAQLRELTNGLCDISIVQADSEKLFTHGTFAAECAAAGILQRFSAPYSHQQNGRIERFFRTMEIGITAMLDYSALPTYLWPYALSTFTTVFNGSSNSDGALTPHEQLTGDRPDASSWRTWGCPVSAYLEKHDHAKFTSKCIPAFNIGPDPTTKDGYHIYITARRAVRTTRHLTFDEFWRARAQYYKQLSTTYPSLLKPFEAPSPPSPPPAPPPSALPSSPPPISFIPQPARIPQAPVAGTHPPGFTPPPSPPPSPPPTLPPDAFSPAPAGRLAPDVASAARPPRPALPAQPARAALAPRALMPQPASPVLDPLAPPDGSNTNVEDRRSVPITPSNDSLDVTHIVRAGVDATTGKPCYVGHYPQSFNMTPEALAERTTNVIGGRNFEVNTITPSIYDATGRNSDVTWRQFGEPAATFPPAMLADFHANSAQSARASRLAARTAPTAALAPIAEAQDAPHAHFCTCPSLDYHIHTHDPSANASAFLSSPMSFPPSHSAPNPLPFVIPPTHSSFLHTKLDSSPTGEVFCFIDFILPTGETPTRVDQALSSVDRRHWRFALDAEHDQLVDAQTWTLVKKSDAKNVISGKWVFKIKRDKDGKIERYKARWVARGFSQKRDIDYTEIFAPVVRYSSIRMLLSLANAQDLNIYGLDVSNAFARADVDEEIYVQMPHGYQQTDPVSGEPLVCKLCKGLYGTKQAARLWHQTLRAHLLADGWCQLESDTCIYIRTTKKHGLEYVGVYVDDIIHICTHTSSHTAFHDYCNAAFPTTTQGELTWILGMEIKRDRASRTLTLNQTRHTLAFLEKYNIPRESKPASTPMDAQWKYGDEPPTQDAAAHSDFRSKVGSLSYISQCTRPDIAYAVNMLCRHLHDPNKHCFTALSHLLRYVNCTVTHGLTYHFGTNTTLRLEAYADSSYGGETKHLAKSHHGFLIYFGGGLIDWSSALQATISQSSAEAEQVAAFHASRTVFYYRQLLEELGHHQGAPTTIWEDNQACIAQSKNPVNHARCKHILLKYHYLRDLTTSHIVKLEYICTKNQLADILTKPCPPAIFLPLVRFLVQSV